VDKAGQHIFDACDFRACTFRNRIWVPPMCQYSAPQGMPTSWHVAHYAALATSTGAVIVEATAISQQARVAPQDLVFDHADEVPVYAALARCIAERSAVPGIQLSHAGRKASRTRPWDGDVAIPPGDGGWEMVAPSAIAFGSGYLAPKEMDQGDINRVLDDFEQSARLSRAAGFRVIEVHAAHGRLIHSFLSPVSNQRSDRYGGSLQNRARFACEVASRIRGAIGADLVLMFRLSCVDWCEGGLTIEDTIEIARMLSAEGVDMIDCSSGGIVKPLPKPTSQGYQVPFAKAVRHRAQISTAAVGMIKSLDQAEEILAEGSADVVLLGRFLMLDPMALMRRAAERGRKDMVPVQYLRAASRAETQNVLDHVPEL
jgi:2,4-dienoyl-CoA reductase-like NADH-dependent reductase (Old Yellow Enzyme family)